MTLRERLAALEARARAQPVTVEWQAPDESRSEFAERLRIKYGESDHRVIAIGRCET